MAVLPRPPLPRSNPEQLEHLLRRTGDDRATAEDAHGTLHQLRVLHQDVDYLLARSGVVLVQLEGFEVPVPADELRRRVGEQIEEALQVGSRERLLQILDDVELDAALAQDVQRAAGLASAGS